MKDTFNPRPYLMQLKGKSRGVETTSDYLETKWRIVWFRTEFPEGSIETEAILIDLDRMVEAEQFVWNAEKRKSEKVVKSAKGIAIFKATIRIGQVVIATAHGSESSVDFGDFIEKAETKAIGRALAGAGFGTQFTGEELSEGHRIVDAPVDFQTNGSNPPPATTNTATQARQAPQPTNNTPTPSAATDDANIAISERQLASIRKLCEELGKPEPHNVTTISSLSAKKLIQQLTAEYRQQHTQQQKATSTPAPKQDIPPAPLAGWTQLPIPEREYFSWSKDVLRSGFTQVCKAAKLPIDSKNWTLDQYKLYGEQLGNTTIGEPLLNDLKLHYGIYHGSAPASLRSLLSRLLMVDEHGKLKQFSELSYKKALTIYGIFALSMPLHDLGKIYDPMFVTLKNQYGFDHPLDLFHHKDGKHNQEIIRDYEVVLWQAYKSKPELLASMQEKYGELIKSWQLAMSA